MPYKKILYKKMLYKKGLKKRIQKLYKSYTKITDPLKPHMNRSGFMFVRFCVRLVVDYADTMSA